jgi:hypothetical protein
MNPHIQRAVEATTSHYRYRLSTNQITSLCLAWGLIWQLNIRESEHLPPGLKWDHLRQIAAGEKPTDDAMFWALVLDMKVGVIASGGFVSHIGLARKPEDFGVLIDIWSKLPDVEGDPLGDVYMAAIHR